MDNDNISEHSYTSNIETGEVVNDNESDEIDINEEYENTEGGLSVGYSWSNINNYNSSLISYNLGIKKLFLNNKLSLGLSTENNTKII